MNVKNKAVELRTSRYTTELGALQKGEDFIKAFALGFDVADAVALLRLDHLYVFTAEGSPRILQVETVSLILSQVSRDVRNQRHQITARRASITSDWSRGW
jgi:RNA-binding protein PNO1